MSTDKMVNALLIAEEFIAEEIENRLETCWDEETPYIKEARDALKAVRNALKLEEYDD